MQAIAEEFRTSTEALETWWRRLRRLTLPPALVSDRFSDQLQEDVADIGVVLAPLVASDCTVTVVKAKMFHR